MSQTKDHCFWTACLEQKIQACRDVTAGKIEMRPLRWWAESVPPGGDRVKASENLGATEVAPVAPVDTSLMLKINEFSKFQNPSLGLI